MLDGAIAAVVAGPVSMMPENGYGPLLGVDPDDFNHDTETFSAIAATLMRHNAISNTLSTKAGELRAAVCGRLGRRSRRAALVHGLLRSHKAAAARLVAFVLNEHARTWSVAADPVPLRRHRRSPVLDARRRGLANPPFARNAWRNIPTVVEALRQFWMADPVRPRRVTSRRPPLSKGILVPLTKKSPPR